MCLCAPTGPAVPPSRKLILGEVAWCSQGQYSSLTSASSLCIKQRCSPTTGDWRLWFPGFRWPGVSHGTNEDRYRLAWPKFCWVCLRPGAVQAFTKVLGFCPELFYWQAEWLQPSSPDSRQLCPKSQSPSLPTSEGEVLTLRIFLGLESHF